MTWPIEYKSDTFSYHVHTQHFLVQTPRWDDACDNYFQGRLTQLRTIIVHLILNNVAIVLGSSATNIRFPDKFNELLRINCRASCI